MSYSDELYRSKVTESLESIAKSLSCLNKYLCPSPTYNKTIENTEENNDMGREHKYYVEPENEKNLSLDFYLATTIGVPVYIDERLSIISSKLFVLPNDLINTITATEIFNYKRSIRNILEKRIKDSIETLKTIKGASFSFDYIVAQLRYNDTYEAFIDLDFYSSDKSVYTDMGTKNLFQYAQE